MSNNVVIYHRGCQDGHCSAFLFWKFIDKDAQFVSRQYGGEDPVPDVKGKDVYILDFSYPRDVLLKMYEEANSLLVLDHHKTAQAELEGLDFCVFDMDKCGAMLTWEHLIKGSHPEAPDLLWLVQYVQDRDLWRWELPDSREMSAALASYPKRFEVWEEIIKEPEILFAEGRAILRYQRMLVDIITSKSIAVNYGDKQAVVVNSPVLQSEVGSALKDTCDFVVIWNQSNIDQILCSLRSREMDISILAKERGGGGHPNAAGYGVGIDPRNILDTVLEGWDDAF